MYRFMSILLIKQAWNDACWIIMYMDTSRNLWNLLTTSRRLTFIHAKLCLTDLRLTSLTKSGVRVCGPDDVYFRHVWPVTRAVDRFLRTDFLGVYETTCLDTRQQWTSSLFSWMFCLIPLSKTCSFDWLGWNFYRRINLHCHEAFHIKGGSSLFYRALITGLAVA